MSKEKFKKAWECFLYFFKISWFTFGGGWSIVAQMQKDFVDEKKELTAEELLDIVSVGRSLPGTMIGNVAYLFGHRRAGALGGVVSVIGMVLPPMLILSVLTYGYGLLKDNIWVAKMLQGVRAAVVPIILAVAIAAPIEHWLKKVIPDVIKLFVVPFVTLVIMVPLTYLVIGPVASVLCSILSLVFNAIYSIPVVGGIIGGILIGAFWQVLVIFGLHWGLVPLAMINYGLMGYDTFLSPYFCVSFAQTFVVLAIILKTKNEKTKKVAIPAFISGIFGVTEPAIYGVTLPKKKPFIYSCIAGAIGGAFTGFMNTRSYSIGGLGLFGLPCFIDTTGDMGITNMIYIIIAILIASAVGFGLTYALYTDE